MNQKIIGILFVGIVATGGGYWFLHRDTKPQESVISLKSKGVVKVKKKTQPVPKPQTTRQKPTKPTSESQPHPSVGKIINQSPSLRKKVVQKNLKQKTLTQKIEEIKQANLELS